MGAVNFIEDILAVSAREGFDILAEDARYVRGNDRYNGTISTCELGSCKLKFPKYLESNNKKAYSFIEKDNYGTKKTMLIILT